MECHTMELHLHSTIGITQPSTMKLHGELRGTPMVILIDYRANHNFILVDVVQAPELVIPLIWGFWVNLGDDHQIVCRGVCSEVKLNV